MSAGVLHAQGSYPFVADSLTRALWHLNESSGSAIYDASDYHNNGIAYGTTVTEGPFGNARVFDGTSDYIIFPSDSSMNFGNESFSIDLWFKTLAEEGVILRRGIAPVPGYMISMHYGCVVGQVGANVDAGYADPLLWAQTPKKYNDNVWHHVHFVRDRDSMKVYLYVDDSLAAPPVVDNLTVPIVTDHPLTIGRWESPASPWYFAGSVDEVLLSSPRMLRTRLGIAALPMNLDFGTIRAGSTKTLPLTVTNTGYGDTLSIDSIVSSSSTVVPSESRFSLPPGGSHTLNVTFAPTTAIEDSGKLTLSSNVRATPKIDVIFHGAAVVIGQKPIIQAVSIDPYSYSMANIVWFRTVDDTEGVSDPIVQYTVWGRSVQTYSRATDTMVIRGSIDSSVGAWQYLATVPAVGFDEYAVSVTHPYYPTLSGYWNECVVVAQSVNRHMYQSFPDTLTPFSVITNSVGTGAQPKEFRLDQNYPNPFNPTTMIRGQWPNACDVRLAVYDVLGREVTVLADGRFPAGGYTFSFNASSLASGIYFGRLTAGNQVATIKMLLMK